MGYTSRWNSTDQIPLRAVNDGRVPRFGAVDPTDGGQSSRYSLSTRWAQTDEKGTTRVSAYVIRSRLDLFSNFTFFLNDPESGDAIQQHDSRLQEGANFQYLHPSRFSWGARRQRSEHPRTSRECRPPRRDSASDASTLTPSLMSQLPTESTRKECD